mmetsp:Transcript_10381/g.25119  ORF Transcript_10381/g.25119 Transcript_10381/m.25119 type:complete len:822 (-) Transcript_10381:2015-4480(-)|eukprot:CAMPEP_0197192214 /NCGR_PEP_ID=MMETSP1423-20130617/24730_1 /TAXON_ID=476441 /ORGANISM="Pseudo-nitzschia heimii, Strain UNC1101" /LENGTH=821 /DNA_ID=CAMNT_0042645057 /DNA_START=72 /DNA_END=2537 /DNA_ORIENTATION=+
MNTLLWSENEIEVSKNGFLLIVDPKLSLPNEEQPLLLHTSAVLLKTLYPSREIEEILLRPGFESNEVCDDCLDDAVTRSNSNRSFTSSVDKLKSIPPVDNKNKKEDDVVNDTDAGRPSISRKYEMYQNLNLVESLSNRIHTALQDIRYFRHRSDGNGSCSTGVDEIANAAKTLQNRQECPPGTKSDRDGEAVEMPSANKNAGKIEVPVPAGGVKNNNLEFVQMQDEATIVKLTRTINSIRALFPHLLPILNHHRISDKNLRIGKMRYKTKRNAPMCWLLGTESFSSCTQKQTDLALDDIRNVLEAFIDIELASEVSKDPKGSPSFWPTSWIKHVFERSNPALISPLKVLGNRISASEEGIRMMARQCDTIICVCDETATQSLDQHYKRAVRKIHQRLSNVLTSRFQGARLSIYGSCLSNLSLGKGSDVDMSLWIPAADTLKRGYRDGSIDSKEYEESMKKLVYQVFRKLSNLRAEFRSMTPITKARIPVITGTYIYAGNPFTEDGSIDFDICFLNDIAVANSNLLREYSLVDPRVRSLMITVKQWAKDQKINSAKEKCISSYSWMNLVVFYLQCVGFAPNLQSSTLMKAANLAPDHDGNYWHFINNLDTFTLKWEEVKRGGLWTMPSEFDELPLSLLLYGFFEFYSFRFPFGTHAVSIRRGNISQSKLATRKVNSFLSIEDPFETYDSYCPHDLGTPANAYGFKKIRNCLRDAEEHLRMVLSSKKDNQKRLWPDPPFVEPEPTRNNGKKSSFKRFERQMLALNDGNDPVAENANNPNRHTVNGMKANRDRQKCHPRHVARGRTPRRSRNDRTKAKRVPKTS